MSYLFYGSQATSIDLSSFDTSNVTNMIFMFSFSKVSYLDLSSFDTSNVTDMSNMFSFSLANTIDLSSFDTSNVTNMSSMFNSAANLSKIYASSSFVLTSLDEDAPSPNSNGSYAMFNGCTSLVGGAGTTYDSNYVNKIRAHIDGGTSNPGYFTAK